MYVCMYTDGGARNNPGPGAVGVLVCDASGKELVRYKNCIGSSTNNVAEYCALIAGLEIAKDLGPSYLECFLDSELIVKQLNGEYKVKNEHMRTLYTEVKSQERCFQKISYAYLPRNHEKMKLVDSLVNQALDESGS